MIATRVPALLFMFMFLTACGAEKVVESDEKSNIDKVSTLVETEAVKVLKKINESRKEVVSKVNDSEITQSQLDYAMNRLLPKKLNKEEREGLSGKVLDSLIGSRLMADHQEAKLDEQEYDLLMIKVNAYKEELLVKKYITENITPQPITRDSVYQYYLNHQDNFGGGSEKTFEVIQSKNNLNEVERKALLIELSKLPTVNDWSNWYVTNKNFKISYKKVTSLVELLKQPLKKIISATDEGATSPLLNEEVLTIVRVNRVKTIPAKSFKEVSREIRRIMAPQALKKSIKSHLVNLRNNASIEYPVLEMSDD